MDDNSTAREEAGMSDASNKDWMPFVKMGFGYLLLICVTGLALAFGLGKVEEKYSFGLSFLMGCLTTLAGGFSSWAFGAAMQVFAGSKEGSEKA